MFALYLAAMRARSVDPVEEPGTNELPPDPLFPYPIPVDPIDPINLPLPAKPATPPQVLSLTLYTSNSGACDDTGHVETPAEITALWTVSRPSATGYAVLVYVDENLADTLTLADTSYASTIEGYVMGGPYNPVNLTRTFRIEIVDSSSGAVVSSLAKSFFTQVGRCG